MEIGRRQFQGLLKFKMAATDQLNFLGGAKTQKISLDNFFLNFNITFLATCGCAIDLLKLLPKFKMAARSQLHFFVGAKT